MLSGTAGPGKQASLMAEYSTLLADPQIIDGGSFLEPVRSTCLSRYAPLVVLDEHECRAGDVPGIGAEATGQAADERGLARPESPCSRTNVPRGSVAGQRRPSANVSCSDR